MLFHIESNQSFATPKYAFWDTDFKLAIMKQKTEFFILSLYLPKGIQVENTSKKGRITLA